MKTLGKTQAELTVLVEAAIRSQPGCETARVPKLRGLPHVRLGRNWEIPAVLLGDCLISDIDRAVITVHRRLGRTFHLVTNGDTGPA
ncbi:MAG: hypothetical protein JOY90_06505 [Bradyrhizobium sp.]|uniref:hypothetical protein n=1 Tax=Bradyrhizobium sp. TaxID=376 RepID=UPI001DDC9000|nr:hypothetical protein [Bradyrhizobium sp.]MBV9560098.1 hypothetical protein [Bradyrhizobium sp.]